MTGLKNFIKDTSGDAMVVEAAILFPIMIMIFAGLVLLAMYLPARATLQRATQHAATVIAAEKSDTWIRYDENAMKYAIKDRSSIENVYVAMFKSSSIAADQAKAEKIVKNMEKKNIMGKMPGTLKVSFGTVNYVVYKEVVVTATQTIPMPVDLSFVKFPKSIEITVTSTAVVQDGEGFVNTVDLIVSLKDFFGSGVSIGDICSAVRTIFG